MASRQIYVIGALGVLIGMVVASSAQRAQTVSFAGHNPNSEIIQNMPQLRKASGIWRRRSDDTTIAGQYRRLTSPRRSTIEQNVEHRMKQRMNGSPEMQGEKIRGAAAPVVPFTLRCEGLSGRRFVNCEADENFQPTYWQ